MDYRATEVVEDAGAGDMWICDPELLDGLCVLHLKFIINKISFLQKDYMLILENLENLETRERKKTKFPSSP